MSLALEGARMNAIVVAALRFRFCARLSTGPATVEELAAFASTSLRGTQAIADGMVALKLWSVTAGRYANTPTAQALLVPESPSYVGDEQPALFQAWLTAFQDLDRMVRDGVPARSIGGENAASFWSLLTPSLARSGRAIAEEVVRAAGCDAAPEVLDVGGGAGALYALAFLRADPAARVTQLDLPHVNAAARQVVEAAGLADCFRAVDGDYRRPPEIGPVDVAVVSNIIHLESPAEARALLSFCHRCLKPGGRLLLSDWVVDDGRSGPSSALMFNFTMLVLTDQGKSYEQVEVRQMVADAGFRDTELTPIGMLGGRAVLTTAGKPRDGDG